MVCLVVAHIALPVPGCPDTGVMGAVVVETFLDWGWWMDSYHISVNKSCLYKQELLAHMALVLHLSTVTIALSIGQTLTW